MVVLALAVLGRGVRQRVAERRLAARLGRVRGGGGAGDPPGHHQATRELPCGDEPRHENLNTGTWEYTLAGRTHQGLHEANGPVFRAEDMPPATVMVPMTATTRGKAGCSRAPMAAWRGPGSSSPA
jgi:hypothetical protein